MNNNYYSSLYTAQAALRLWTQDDADSTAPARPKLQKIVYVNSFASLVPVPGYLAYNDKSSATVVRGRSGTDEAHVAAKVAQRALSDTLRLEATRYSGPKSTCTVQCIFAHNFITPTFLREQMNKPELTKRIDGTTGTLADLEKKFPSAAEIAPKIVANVANGDYAVCDDRLGPQLLWSNTSGANPSSGWCVVDTLMALVMWIAWPFVRRDMKRESWGDALKEKRSGDSR